MSLIAQESHEYREMLHEHGYITLLFAIDGAQIDPLFEQFREFSELAWAPDGSGKELVDAMHYTVPKRPKDADYFMVHRRVGETNPFNADRTPGTDNKDLAHIGPLSRRLAHERLGNRMPTVMRDFLDSCVQIHEETKRAVQPVFRALGLEEVMLARNPEDDIHMVRVLRYLGSTSTHKADLHFDRAVATLAAWESSPGLVGAPGNNAIGNARLSYDELQEVADQANATPIAHRSGEAKFFLGAGYNRLPSDVRKVNGNMPLLAHGVINQNPDQERDAVVVFMNPHVHARDYTVPSPAETGLSDVSQFLSASIAS